MTRFGTRPGRLHPRSEEDAMIDQYAGLPISLDPVTGELAFHDGLICDGSSSKKVGQMTGLYADMNLTDPGALVYRAYRNIRFPEHDALFSDMDIRYDITVILPGTVNGEFHKTSGHFHGCGPGKKVPYTEVYEVIAGEIIFILQHNTDFMSGHDNCDSVLAVHVNAGQAIVIPPFCGHGSINPAGSVSAFSNLAVTSCPLHYDPISRNKGLAARIMKYGEGFTAIPNDSYPALPAVSVCVPEEAPHLGISFGVPCYRRFVDDPDIFSYLTHPEKYSGSSVQKLQIVRHESAQ